MAEKITKEDVIEFISNMTVLELSELVKELEDKFGVKASAPVMAMAAQHAIVETDELVPAGGIDPEKVNPMGNAIALGHPLGATGAILTLTCAYALRRKRQRYGLVTMCIGGGQGTTLILESIN